MIPRIDVLGRIPILQQGRHSDANLRQQPSWTPGTLGWKDDAETLLVNAQFLGKGKKKRRKASHRKKTRILNIVTTFPNPWKGKITEEIAALSENRWAPSTDDFEALVKDSHPADHFYHLIGYIVRQPKGSIERINIFTHSNPELIAFKGTINPKTTFAEVLLETQSALSLEMLENITSGTYFEVGRKKTRYTMTDIKERFTKDAKVFFYSCKSGVDTQLLQEFADKFQVTAVGFKDNICYCPKYTARSIDRQYVGIGKSCGSKGSNFTAIDKQGTERKPSK